MSTQAPVREARDQTDAPEEIVAERKRTVAPEVTIGADDLYIVRSEGALIALSALTCLNAGALLGATFLGRRVVHGGRIVRLTTSRPRNLVMLPFTAIKYYVKHRRGIAFPRLHVRRGNAPHASAGWPHRVTQLVRLAAPRAAISHRVRPTASIRRHVLPALLGRYKRVACEPQDESFILLRGANAAN